MSLDTPQENAHASNQDQGGDHTSQKKQRPPGVIALRIVILLFMLTAANSALNLFIRLRDGSIDLVLLITLGLALVAGFGLLLRTNAGRCTGIALLWFVLASNLIGLIYTSVILLGVAAETIDAPKKGNIGLSTTLQLLNIALVIWMLTVVHSQKIIALMERSTPPAPRQA